MSVKKPKRLQVYISNKEYDNLAEALGTAHMSFAEMAVECEDPVGKQRLFNISQAVLSLYCKIYPHFGTPEHTEWCKAKEKAFGEQTGLNYKFNKLDKSTS